MYARYGAGMLERLNGIFALAIWDDERRELFLARDRLGVKPLYYAQRNGTLYFASEVKALLQALPRPALRRDAVADYLTFLWVPDPDTIFEGVYKLPPGHFATYSQDGLRIQQFWDVSFAPEELPEDEWADRLRDEVFSAIRRQMISDVPLGSFLSGGIDSSAIVAESQLGHGQADHLHAGLDEGGSGARDRPRRPRLRAPGGEAVRRRLPRADPRRGHRRAVAEARLAPGRAGGRPGRDHDLPDLLGRARAADRDPERDGRRRGLRRLSASPRGQDRPHGGRAAGRRARAHPPLGRGKPDARPAGTDARPAAQPAQARRRPRPRPDHALPHLLLVLPARGAERRPRPRAAGRARRATTRSGGTVATSTAFAASTGSTRSCTSTRRRSCRA